jgi:excisionase family DNA binding protein
MSLKNHDYIPLSEASKITGYTIDHLRRLIQKGKVRGERIGRNYVTTRSAVRDYLASSPKPGPKPKIRQ